MDKETARQRHEDLLHDGWVRRFSAEEPRLSEMKEFYESLGMEVTIEPGMVGEDEECKSCFEAEGFEDRYKTIYTRQGQGGQSGPEEDLFE
ncbi:MAG: hypothetical protein P8182_17485 [Deltaproteobacteria bacterium]